MRVVPNSEGRCPSCRVIIFDPSAAAVAGPQNPFGDQIPNTAASDARDVLNPYAPPAMPATSHATGDPLLFPAMILLIGSTVWLVLAMLVVGVKIFTGDLLDRLPQEESVGELAGYLMVALFPAATLVGAGSMLTRQSRRSAWAGAIVAMIPFCGPCYGLLFPFAIWAIIVLRRPEVQSQFKKK